VYVEFYTGGSPLPLVKFKCYSVDRVTFEREFIDFLLSNFSHREPDARSPKICLGLDFTYLNQIPFNIGASLVHFAVRFQNVYY